MKNIRKYLLYIIMLMIMSVLTGCGKATIDLNKYITIEADGYDSKGTATYTFDYDAFYEDFEDKIKAETKDNEEVEVVCMLVDSDAEALLELCVLPELDETSGLSNGDKIVLEWDCDDEMAEKYFNCKLKYSDITYEVKGLEEIEEFNPFDYVEVSFEGISSKGIVVIKPDDSKSEMQYINFSVDKASGLTSGENVNITASLTCSEDSFIEEYGAVLEKTDKIYTVEGLTEVDLFNPFDYVEISFTGVSPKGSIKITPDYNQSEMQYINFSVDNESGLALGDSVRVTASISGSEDSFVEKFGSIIGKNEETYTVEGIAKYITDISELPKETYDEMDNTLREELASDFESWDNEYLKDMQLLGTYVVTLKEGKYSYSNSNNYVYFVYKVTAENDESNGEFNYYWYGYYVNASVFEDGTSGVKIDTYHVPDKGWFASEVVKIDGQKNYSYYGFKDLDSLYNKHIVEKIDSYEFKSTVSE